jgi:uncharacterized protein (DUF2141 family)
LRRVSALRRGATFHVSITASSLTGPAAGPLANPGAGILAGIRAGVLMLVVAAAAPAFAQSAAPAPAARATSAAPTEQATPAAVRVLRVRVTDLRDSSGQVVCTLFDSSGAFPSDSTRAVGQITVQIKNGAATCSFEGLAPGRYALVTFHDENSNGRFDRNWFGLPKEGYAFSNNVRPVFSPPSFNAAAFYYAGGDQWLTVAMRY